MSEPALIRIPIGEMASARPGARRPGRGRLLRRLAGAGRRALPTVALDDYDALSITWQCQVTSASLNSTPNITTNERAGTFCRVPGQSVVVGDDTLELALGYFQDVHVTRRPLRLPLRELVEGVLLLLRVRRGQPAAGDRPVRLVAGAIGGDTHVDLTATAPLPVLRRPDIEFGVTGTTRIVLGAGDDGRSRPGVAPMSAGAEYRALAKRYRHLPELVVRAGAAEIKRSLLVQLDRDTGGDRVLSGTARRGRTTKLGVSVTVQHSRELRRGENQAVTGQRALALELAGARHRGTGRRRADPQDVGAGR